MKSTLNFAFKEHSYKLFSPVLFEIFKFEVHAPPQTIKIRAGQNFPCFAVKHFFLPKIYAESCSV